LAIAAERGYEVHLMDVKTTFLNGILDEDIYMMQPPGFTKKGYENWVCKLNKTIYGLKQSARYWYQRIKTYMKSIGFHVSKADSNVYIYTNPPLIVIVAIYVDDCLIICNDKRQLVQKYKKLLSAEFEMTDQGPVQSLLGIQIERNLIKKELKLNQKHYIQNVLKKYNMADCKPIDTPFATGQKLTLEMRPQTEEEKRMMQDVPYQSAVGSLMYAMISTRPDIAYAVGVVSQFLANPGPTHWTAVKRIMRYLQGTLDYCLIYNGRSNVEDLKQSISPIGYTDSDWAGETDNRKSTAGYTFLINETTISWSSKRQNTVALSSAEAEYLGCTQAVKEALWLKHFFNDINEPQTLPILIHCDNQSAIALTENPKFHARTKHIEIRHHFIREHVEKSEVKIQYCPTEKMVADVLTKALPKAKHVWCTYNFGIRKGGHQWGHNEVPSPRALSPQKSSSRAATPMSRKKLMKLDEE
jgi:hypothetical protein